MSYGLLGFNFLTAAGAVDICRRVRPRAALFFDDALTVIDAVQREGTVQVPIGRRWLEGEPNQVATYLRPWAGQPVWPTPGQNYDMGRELADALVYSARWVQAWQGYNEWPTYGRTHLLSLYCAFEIGFSERLHEHSCQSVVLNPPVGNLDAVHLALFDELLSKADFLGAHTYGADPTRHDPGQLMSLHTADYSMRPRAWIEAARQRQARVPPLIRTEAGTWRPWKGEHPDVVAVSAQQIGDDFWWLGDRMLEEAYEVGACLYCYNSNGDPRWDGFALDNEPALLELIERYNATHPAPPFVDGSAAAGPPAVVQPGVPRFVLGFAEYAAGRNWTPLADERPDWEGNAYITFIDLYGSEGIMVWDKASNRIRHAFWED